MGRRIERDVVRLKLQLETGLNETKRCRRWSMSRKSSRVLVLAAVAVFMLAGSGRRGCRAAGVNRNTLIFGHRSTLRHALTPQVLRAVAKGLSWLAKRQKANGSFGSMNSVAVSALGGLAFIAGGNLPGQGRYGRNCQKVIGYVLSQCQPTGLIADANDGAPMYGQGFATLFLAEVYGESHERSLRRKLQRAVRLIVETQNQQGGWRYQPMPMPADISVTICQVMALRAARQAGIAVPHRTILKAISFVRQLQNPDGGFSYMLGSPGSMMPRSAAGVALLFYAGVYRGKAVAAGVHYLLSVRPGTPANNQYNFFYGNYYGTQAMFLAGGKWWNAWWPAMSKTLLDRQDADGSWHGNAGFSYGTAMALIILQIPDRLLPVLQK